MRRMSGTMLALSSTLPSSAQSWRLRRWEVEEEEVEED